jgi:hypothetical protein
LVWSGFKGGFIFLKKIDKHFGKKITKKISKLLKIQKTNLKIDWHTPNPNKIFRAHENISNQCRNLFSSKKIEKSRKI